MRERACDLIYLNTKRYTSISNLRTLYWAIIIFPCIMMLMSIAAINTNGVSWKSLFPLISIAIWSLLYWIFVLMIQSKKTKKTFELRFLVNGISGLLVSSLFWIFCTSFNLVADDPVFEFDFSLWILFLYLIFSVAYIALIVIGVHKGIYKKIREKGHTPRAIAVDAFFASIIPVAGLLGMVTSKLLRAYASVSVQNIVATVAFVLIIFLPALAHINFVQYFYCKKYGILCDEYGDTTSPKLERQIKEKKEKINNLGKKQAKKKVPLIIKILIGIVSVPIIFFVIVFIVFFIKGFIQGIA